jgi:hypothetical protein
MIDLANETLVSLAQAAAMLPPGRRGSKVHLGTIMRWILDGVKRPTGRVQLEAIRVGGRWLTSKEALQQFAERLTADCSQPVQWPRTPAARLRASELAAKRLEEAGI